ncbi:hypothetical protein ALI22I_01485 [Saccharothrix sp. ALI-22-I]|uniref:YbaB/EbfC family nucleoid-associated protein n=1 Tax=Saccharothrix sp. ALI-22-I TaxID=1933778 RepID=UPI00097C776B|nr:YbaB/EbfC family nucleoid-associated protein [Saccharothrix sp. ALI-22-I]ONI92877.1 hypothetical protein ALI22I_01485 [Saccharothrix sp. ALI-22-I]
MDGTAPGTTEFERLAEGIREVRDGLTRLRATAHSPDGLISATVGAHGALLDLDIDPRVYRDPDSRALADAITATVRAATERAGQQAVRLARRLLPDGGPEDVDPAFDPLLHHLEGGGRAWRR